MLRRPLALCWLLVAVIHVRYAEAQWVTKPSKELLETTPGLVHETFESPSMKTTVGYSVVLPPSYNTSERRFPVVYWLHGGGGNECSSLFTSKAWHDLYKTEQVREVILVYPSAFRSGYMDHHDGKIMVESMIIRELIPRIDRRFRTIASRSGRAAHGFSMGASGSLKFAIKYPELFSTAVAYGGGAVDLQRSNSAFILNILKRNLNSDPELIRQNNTYHFLEQNHAVLRRNGVRILLICGEDDTWKESAVTFQAALQEKSIPCQLKLVPGVGHRLQGLTKAAGTAAAIFQDEVFRDALSKAPEVSNNTASTINESYFSPAEGRRQQFQVVLPPGYSTEVKYPLMVQVFGSASLLPTLEQPFIRVRPNGRGVWGYRSMSRYDVMQVIERMKTAYNIDEDRVYMTGTSAGATGMMHTAAYRQDVFAGLVPLVAFGNDLPLENFRNLPIRCEHGVNDWTSAIGNVRTQFQKLEKLGYDAVLNEHPTAGHGIGSPPPKTMQWLLRLKRNASPKHIVHTCEHPRNGGAYWLRIESFQDPHQVARIEAKVAEDGLKVITQNVREFSFDLLTAPLLQQQNLNVDGMPIEYTREAEQQRLTLIKRDNWRTASPQSLNGVGRRAYGAGAAANLFQGEPLLVVHGTGADHEFLQQAASILARSGGPYFKPANVQFPVRADADLKDLDLEHHNLLLVGTPQNNSYLRKIAGKLPYTIENGVLNAGDRKPLSLDGSVLGFHFFNPDQPQQLIYIVSPYLNEAERKQFLQNPRHYLAGAPGFKMIDQADLFVRGADLRIRREMQLDADWRFIQVQGEDKRIPDRFSDRVHLAFAHLKVMQQTADVDLAFWWGPQDKGLFGGYDFNWLPTLDPESYTMADYAVRKRETETMTAVLSGAELTTIFDRWITTQELVTWPAVKREDINVDRSYRIVIPMDLVPKLGNRKKVLSTVAPGPAIMPDQVAREMFAPTNPPPNESP